METRGEVTSVIHWPGGVKVQLYGHTAPRTYAPGVTNLRILWNALAGGSAVFGEKPSRNFDRYPIRRGALNTFGIHGRHIEVIRLARLHTAVGESCDGRRNSTGRPKRSTPNSG
jgi:hypothetical protein